MTWIIRLGKVAAALTAIGVVLAYLSTFIAWSSDVRRLDRHQADQAVEIYDSKVRRYLAVPPPADPVANQNWSEELRRSRSQLDAAEKRRIELSK